MSSHIEFLEELNQLVSDAGYEDVILITEINGDQHLRLTWNIDHFGEEERNEVTKVIGGALVILLNSEKYSDIQTSWIPPVGESNE